MTVTNAILLTIASIQALGTLLAGIAAFNSVVHGRALARIDNQTNHTNEVLQAANLAAHTDMSRLAQQLADQGEPVRDPGPVPPP
jgi:hypothetical protein